MSASPEKNFGPPQQQFQAEESESSHDTTDSEDAETRINAKIEETLSKLKTSGQESKKTWNILKILVSKNKNRYVNEGFDLDLSYILPNVIAMGFPSQGIEGLYRNHMEDVQRFFNKQYYPNYKIYNLCSERKYDEQSFHCCSQIYTFDDHNPPIFMLMVDFC